VLLVTARELRFGATRSAQLQRGVNSRKKCLAHHMARQRVQRKVETLVVGPLGFAQAVELLHPVQADLGREVNPQVFSAPEFTHKASKPNVP